MGYVAEDAHRCRRLVLLAQSMPPRTDMAAWTGIGRLVAECCVSDAMTMAGEDGGRWTTGRLQPWLPYLNAQLVRFCPQCLREDLPFANAWLLEPVTACTVHRTQLRELWSGAADTSESRGHFNPYTWRALMMWPRARENMTLRSAEPASECELRLASFVESVMGGVPSNAKYPQELSRMAPLEALRLLRFLGLHGEASDRAKPLKVALRRVLRASRRSGEAADLALFEWPKNIGDYLSSITRVVDPAKEVPRLRAMLGPFYDYIFREFSGENFLFFRQEVAKHLLREYPGLINEKHKRLLSVSSIKGAEYLSGKDAASMLGTSYDALLRLIKQDLVPGHVLERSGLVHSRVLVARSDLSRIQEVIDGLLTVQQARKILCLSRRQMEALTRTRILEFPSTAHAEGQMLLTTRIQWITKALQRSAQRSAAPVDAIDLQRVGIYVGKDGFASVVSALLVQGIPYWKTESEVPLQVLVKREDVLLWRRRERLRAAGGLSTVPELSRELRMKQEVLYHLIRRGLLRAEVRRVDFREQTLVKDEDMDTFLRMYTTPGRKGFHATSWALRRLEALGVYPITGPHIDGCRQYFCRNDESLEVALAKIRWRTGSLA